MRKLTYVIIVGIIVQLGYGGYQIYRNNRVVTINIQPLDQVMEVIDIDTVSKELDLYLKEIGLTNYEIKILPNKKSPDNSLIWYSYEDMDYYRLRADSLVRFLNTNNKKEFTIGIINYDICCDVHGIKNFGILGLSYMGHRFNSCIVSTHRVKNKNDVWKVMAHEFTHGYFSQGHCKANDPHCIMQDANKKPNFRIKSSLCDVCMEEVRSKLK